MFERLLAEAARVEHEQLVHALNRRAWMLPRREQPGWGAWRAVVRTITRRRSPAVDNAVVPPARQRYGPRRSDDMSAIDEPQSAKRR